MHSPAIFRLILTASVSIAMAQGATPVQETVPLFTPALEQRLHPPCPQGCEPDAPFTATYRKAGQKLVFLAAKHVFIANNGTFRAIDSAFAAGFPALVIVEGFPTAWGESPAPIVQEAQGRAAPGASDYARGEAMYAASVALSRGIPFLGGEPAPAEQVQALEHRGYAAPDIAFAYLVQDLSQSVRSGDVAAGSGDPKLAAAFARWAQGFVDRYSLKPLSLEEFSARYQLMFRVAVTEDSELAERPSPGTDSAVALLIQADMNVRDKHLLATIEKELASKKRVLVVYGEGHWTTLSRALQKRLGKPTITGIR
jgi:hypothetical protein